MIRASRKSFGIADQRIGFRRSEKSAVFIGNPLDMDPASVHIGIPDKTAVPVIVHDRFHISVYNIDAGQIQAHDPAVGHYIVSLASSAINAVVSNKAKDPACLSRLSAQPGGCSGIQIHHGNIR